MRERFVASEKIDHLHIVDLPWINRFQRRKPLIYRNVDLDDFELLADRRTVANFVVSVQETIARFEVPRSTLYRNGLV
jgi:hypothetical protein